jgi:RNA polymerase sigma-70 factor (ECF subfamily)
MPHESNIIEPMESIAGDTHPSRDELIVNVYNELRRLATAYLRRERVDHTLQPTALVHEAS